MVREGKVPSAWFLEQVDAKGMTSGGIHVADYHANLIYNTGGAQPGNWWGSLTTLKARVRSGSHSIWRKKSSTSGFEALASVIVRLSAPSGRGSAW